MEDQTASKIIPTHNIEATIHPNYPLISSPSLVDRSIQNKFTSKIYPESSDIDGYGSIEFNIDATPQHFIDTTSLMLDLKLKVVDTAGNHALAAAHSYYLANNVLQSMFNSVKVFLNDVPIESSYNNSHTAFFTQLVFTDTQLVERQGICQGAFNENKGTLVNVELDANHMLNETIAKRITFSKQASIHIRGPLKTELTSLDKFLIDGVNIRIILEPNKSAFIVNCVQPVGGVGPQNYAVKITNASLLVDKYKVSDGPYLSTNRSLISGTPMEYILRKVITHTTLFPIGYDEIIIHRPFISKIPNKMYLFFTDHSSNSGDYQRSPYYYGSNDLSHYSVYIDGQQIAGGDCSSPYTDVYIDSLKKHSGNYFVSKELYTSGGFIICFGTSENENNSLYIDGRGDLTIKLKLSTPLLPAKMVYLLALVDTTFSIDSDKEISTSFAY